MALTRGKYTNMLILSFTYSISLFRTLKSSKHVRRNAKKTFVAKHAWDKQETSNGRSDHKDLWSNSHLGLRAEVGIAAPEAKGGGAEERHRVRGGVAAACAA